jgi:hypothetical protein
LCVATAVAEIEATVADRRAVRIARGKRDALIDLFKREFTETQEEVGSPSWGSSAT